MKSALWLAVGVGLGFVVAHQVNRTPQGRAFFADLDARTREFTDGIADGYRSREAELRDGVGPHEADTGDSGTDSARRSADAATR